MQTPLVEYLWGNKARLRYLLVASALMLLCMLGGRELWTQEWRWADICWQMMYSGDYLHPYLAGEPYYDKPLLSYWLMIVFSYLVGGLSEWALRLPPALAGILTIYCTYRLGTQLADRRVGLIAGWMLATTYYFIFWARTANSDMLNVAGIMLALVWYFARRERPGFVSYSVFFLIIAVTSLFKGLIGMILPLLAVLPDLLRDKTWKKHLRFSLILALVPAVFVYLLPFWASGHFGGQEYGGDGLYQVYRENILRYFEPFDHKDPIYTYILFLPIYMLPWAIFLIPAVLGMRKQWSQMSAGSRWFVWSTLLIFLFFTFSGSRRNYYTLPIVPFATLLTADWIAKNAKRMLWAGRVTLVSFILLFLMYGIVQPLYYVNGLKTFSQEVRKQAEISRPWSDWQIDLLDARSKLSFYLQPAKPVKQLGLSDNERARNSYSAKELIQQWPVISSHKPDTILVTRVLYLEKLKPYLKNYQVIIAKPPLGDRLFNIADSDQPVAFIPLPHKK